MFSESAAYDFYASHGGSGISVGNYYSSSASTLSNSKPGISRTSELFNTYYIYTFDGKLLAEYDHNGNCTRDYIYFGNRLLAEYKPQTDEYFYYMTDQINSTRIITDANGNVVFSEAYGPYGDVQKTWVNTYNPKLKFSGKEREGYSDLDYFGARYYDNKSYRFNSVDPIINKEEALVNPQAWNLYVYCKNNPITYFDPDGRSETAVIEAGKTVTQLIPLLITGGPYAAVGAAIIAGVYIGIKATEEGYPIKTARQYEHELMQISYDAWVGKKKDNVILSKGGKKATDSTKGMPHGDSGRAMEKGNKQIAELEEKLKTAKGNEAKRIRWKIQRIRKDAQKKKKGGTDWRK